MTPKELLYLEDSLGMEQQLQIKCHDYSGKIQDSALKGMLGQLAQDHQKHFSSLMGQLN
jgi:hypothetical protein